MGKSRGEPQAVEEGQLGEGERLVGGRVAEHRQAVGLLGGLATHPTDSITTSTPLPPLPLHAPARVYGGFPCHGIDFDLLNSILSLVMICPCAFVLYDFCPSKEISRRSCMRREAQGTRQPASYGLCGVTQEWWPRIY